MACVFTTALPILVPWQSRHSLGTHRKYPAQHTSNQLKNVAAHLCVLTGSKQNPPATGSALGISFQQLCSYCCRLCRCRCLCAAWSQALHSRIHPAAGEHDQHLQDKRHTHECNCRVHAQHKPHVGLRGSYAWLQLWHGSDWLLNTYRTVQPCSAPHTLHICWGSGAAAACSTAAPRSGAC
jgi:hypothetical protein